MRLSSRRCHIGSCILALLIAVSPSSAGTGAGATAVLFPPPGTYRLERIKEVPPALVIEDSVWKPRRLSTYTTGSVTLFSFFYGTCKDPQGCPTAWSVFESIHQEIEADQMLSGRVRLVFVSLDPSVDTPELLSFYRTKSKSASPWYFLTTWSERFLKPILNGMGLTISYKLDEKGQRTGEILHMLKIYLIDAEGWVREIYTTDYIDPDVALNDIRTLVLEKDRRNGKS